MKQDYILIGADFAPIENDGKRIINGKQEEVLDQRISEMIMESSFSLFNMEAPIAFEGMVPIKKDGPNLSIPSGAEKIYGNLGVDLLLLANNHIMDYGKEGLFHTMECLDAMNISYIGAGQNTEMADSVHFALLNEKKIGLYAVAEREFSLAEKETPGANGFDEMHTDLRIQSIKKECDFLIVFYHGGRELYPYPSPEQQKRCRRMVEYGADAVVCQHSHCIGAMEYYNKGCIYYGQGNFLFGDAEAEICIYSTLLKISVGEELTFDMVPVKRDKDKVRLLTGEEEARLQKQIAALNEDIKREGFVQSNYKKLAVDAIAPYLYQFSGWPLWAIRFDKLFKRRLIKRTFEKKEKRLLYLQNILQCDTHRELVLEGLKQLQSRNDK